MTHLLTIQESVLRAVDRMNDKPNPELKLKTRTFRADEEKTNLASQICQRHGISLGAFLRECIEGLVIDYTPTAKDNQDSDI